MKIKPYLQEMNEIVSQILTAKQNIQMVMSEIDIIDKNYQNQKLDYKVYIAQKKKILSGKTENEVMRSYEKYLSSLKKKLHLLNNKVTKIIYSDRSYVDFSLENQKSKEKYQFYHL
jgi:hypothetical protein